MGFESLIGSSERITFMIKEYIQYLKDNPEHLWFKRKIYGWGWTPATWQGWLVILVYAVSISILSIIKEEEIAGDPNSGSNFLTFALPIIILTTLLIIIAYKFGEKPRFQWGIKKLD